MAPDPTPMQRAKLIDGAVLTMQVATQRAMMAPCRHCRHEEVRCSSCDKAGLLAALPHLLEAVVGEMIQRNKPYDLAVLEDGVWSEVVPADRLLAALYPAPAGKETT